MSNKVTLIITKTIEIGYQTFENAIVTALEGGSNYWYWINDDSIPPKDAYPEDLAPAQRIARYVWDGGKIKVYDLEDPSVLLGVISMDNLEANLEHTVEEWEAVVNETYDVTEADNILQYIVMGEIVFG